MNKQYILVDATYRHIYIILVVKVKLSCNRPWRPIGLWDVEAPIFCRQSAHRWRWGCQSYAPAAIYAPGRFLVLISVRGWIDPRITMGLKGLGKLKKFNYLIGTPTCDLPACSIVPQPTTLPRAPVLFLWFLENVWICYFVNTYTSLTHSWSRALLEKLPIRIHKDQKLCLNSWHFQLESWV
jgi:hypothetical protein